LLTPGRIVRAKLMASLRVSTVLTLLLTEQVLLGYALVRELQIQLFSIIPFFLIILATCLVTSSLGLMWSSLVRKTSVAIIATYLSLLVIFVLPIGLYQWALTIFPDTPDDILRWCMTPSPYASALSVPIVGNRLTGTGAAITPMVRPLAFANVQIYVISLGISLLISLICHLITLVAFRYKWWKARESV
jgi:hypothetical protein